MESINYVEIGTLRSNLKPRMWLSNFMPRNEYRPMVSFPQANDGTLHYKNVDRYYFPMGSFETNFKTAEQYAEAVQIVNGDPFFIKYFDPEILTMVIRKVRMTANSTRLFINSANKYLGVSNYAFEVESIFAYDNYQDLKNKAINDSRF